jgi:hypothetical protein
METVKVTNEQVINFRLNAQRYIDQRPGVFSKFIYGLNKGLKATKKAFEDYSENHSDLRYDFASKDEKTQAIIVDRTTNDFQFTEANRRLFDKALKALTKEEVTVNAYELDQSAVPLDVTVSLLDVLSPFVLSEDVIENIFKEYKPVEK